MQMDYSAFFSTERTYSYVRSDEFRNAQCVPFRLAKSPRTPGRVLLGVKKRRGTYFVISSLPLLPLLPSLPFVSTPAPASPPTIPPPSPRRQTQSHRRRLSSWGFRTCG